MHSTAQINTKRIKNTWINDILDAAVKEVQSWPTWMQQGRVRVTEPEYDDE